MPAFVKKGALRVAGAMMLCSLAAMPTLSGCAMFGGDSPSAPAAPDMRMEALFNPTIHRCSRISPEIRIEDIPAGTDRFVVRLVEQQGETERHLGGGEWPNDGSGVIPEGVLNRHYQGPCPPEGREGRFIYVVSAMRRGSPQPLAVRVFPVILED